MTATRLDIRLLPYPDIYASLFKNIVETKPGVLNYDQVMRELSDYTILIEAVSKVYYEITDGRITKPNTMYEAVIAVYQDRVQNYINEAIQEEFEALREVCTCGALKL